MKDSKIWLIIGISRGLGKALAQAVLDKGDIVIGTTRDGKADLPLDTSTAIANSAPLIQSKGVDSQDTQTEERLAIEVIAFLYMQKFTDVWTGVSPQN